MLFSYPGRSSDEDDLDENYEINFLPKSWQGELDDEDGENMIANDWYRFMIGTITRTKLGLMATYRIVVVAFIIIYLCLDLICGNFSCNSIRSSILAGGVFRLVIWNGTVLLFAFWGLQVIDDSHWAKDIITG